MATMTATSEPPAAASAEAMPKAIMWMRCTSIPQTWATSRLWDTARMALPRRARCRKAKAAPVIATAKAQAITRDVEKANGPSTKEPVRYSTERRSEVKASWARFTSPMATPKVRSSDDSSGASTTRRTRVRCRSMPTANSSGIDTSSERYGFRPNQLNSQNVVYAPSISSGPWATFSTRITPKISPSPRATMAYIAPARSPEMTTWPSMTGVMITASPAGAVQDRTTPAGGSGGRSRATRDARGLPLVPGRRGEARLGVGELVGPDDHPLAVLPLQQDHLVRRLEAVGLHAVVAEGRLRLELEELIAHLVGVERARALGRLDVDEAPRVARHRMVGGVVLEPLLVGGEKLLLPRVREGLVPLRRPVDVLGVLLEQVVELRQVAADGEPEHLRVHVELLHLARDGHGVVEVGAGRDHVRVQRLDLHQEGREVRVALRVRLLEHD